MLNVSQILVRTLGLAACVAALAACGQRGPLFLPKAPAAAQRATLPQTLLPGDSAVQPPRPSLPPTPSASTAQ
ncbi:LPS translocon maturation chaperone LptM [Simplicispira hankyongi]|uniref:Sugar transporter n=1 Tax=Simplicispira hankyongi TaxID=2315688 RepID=A0A398CC16_9BURK|nr:lipoprotein [Simplicispira hankyongi]RID98478.1 hypothetical protein D3F03_09610 [Simplicispira hankyongi]